MTSTPISYILFNELKSLPSYTYRGDNYTVSDENRLAAQRQLADYLLYRDGRGMSGFKGWNGKILDRPWQWGDSQNIPLGDLEGGARDYLARTFVNYEDMYKGSGYNPDDQLYKIYASLRGKDRLSESDIDYLNKLRNGEVSIYGTTLPTKVENQNKPTDTTTTSTSGTNGLTGAEYVDRQRAGTSQTYKTFDPNTDAGKALIESIWVGKYGNGQARRDALTMEYGAANAKAIQDYINESDRGREEIRSRTTPIPTSDPANRPTIGNTDVRTNTDSTALPLATDIVSNQANQQDAAQVASGVTIPHWMLEYKNLPTFTFNRDGSVDMGRGNEYNLKGVWGKDQDRVNRWMVENNINPQAWNLMVENGTFGGFQKDLQAHTDRVKEFQSKNPGSAYGFSPTFTVNGITNVTPSQASQRPGTKGSGK